jgi:DNA-directed RNA polymerase subunit RPC12/RpoP
MSKIGKIAKCSVCGQEKTIFYDWSSDPQQQEKLYCKECYESSKQKLRCAHCGEQVKREFYADHLRDMHSK